MLDGPSPRVVGGGTPPASPEEVADWLANLPSNYIACRAMKHAMKLRDVYDIGRNGRDGEGHLYRCTSCRYEVTYVLNAAGFIVDKINPTYPKGYLAPKGAGRGGQARNGQMRLAEGRRFKAAKKK